MNDLENKLKERNARMFADQSKEVRIGITQLMEEIDEILEMWKKEVENREIRQMRGAETLSSAESTHTYKQPHLIQDHCLVMVVMPLLRVSKQFYRSSHKSGP